MTSTQPDTNTMNPNPVLSLVPTGTVTATFGVMPLDDQGRVHSDKPDAVNSPWIEEQLGRIDAVALLGKLYSQFGPANGNSSGAKHTTSYLMRTSHDDLLMRLSFVTRSPQNLTLSFLVPREIRADVQQQASARLRDREAAFDSWSANQALPEGGAAWVEYCRDTLNPAIPIAQPPIESLLDTKPFLQDSVRPALPPKAAIMRDRICEHLDTLEERFDAEHGLKSPALQSLSTEEILALPAEHPHILKPYLDAASLALKALTAFANAPDTGVDAEQPWRVRHLGSTPPDLVTLPIDTLFQRRDGIPRWRADVAPNGLTRGDVEKIYAAQYGIALPSGALAPTHHCFTTPHPGLFLEVSLGKTHKPEHKVYFRLVAARETVEAAKNWTYREKAAWHDRAYARATGRQPEWVDELTRAVRDYYDKAPAGKQRQIVIWKDLERLVHQHDPKMPEAMQEEIARFGAWCLEVRREYQTIEAYPTHFSAILDLQAYDHTPQDSNLLLPLVMAARLVLSCMVINAAPAPHPEVQDMEDSPA